jgi:hypothetical protein
VLLITLALGSCESAGSDGVGEEPGPGDPSSLGWRPAVYTYTDGNESYRMTYTYDDAGKVTQVLFESQASVGADWMPEYRKTYTYDGSDVLASTVTEDNDGNTDPPTWTTTTTNTMTFNAHGRMTELILDSPGASDPDTRMRAEYANDRLTYLFRGERETDAAEWIDDGRIAVTISADGSTMNWDFQDNTGTAAEPVWASGTEDVRETIIFDADGRVSTDTSERTEDGGTTWTVTNNETTTYNADGWILSFTEVDGDDDDSGCTPASPCTSVVTFSFDEETGLPTAVTMTEETAYTGTITWEEGAMNDAFLLDGGAATIADGWEASWIFSVIWLM